MVFCEEIGVNLCKIKNSEIPYLIQQWKQHLARTHTTSFVTPTIYSRNIKRFVDYLIQYIEFRDQKRRETLSSLQNASKQEPEPIQEPVQPKPEPIEEPKPEPIEESPPEIIEEPNQEPIQDESDDDEDDDDYEDEDEPPKKKPRIHGPLRINIELCSRGCKCCRPRQRKRKLTLREKVAHRRKMYVYESDTQDSLTEDQDQEEPQDQDQDDPQEPNKLTVMSFLFVLYAIVSI